MKAEIYKNGPISCGIYMTKELKNNYDGSIWSQVVDNAAENINQEVSVVGYGTDAKVGAFWIVRNTFGTNWGDLGYFYIQMNQNNLGIESDCMAGTPSFDKPATSYLEII